MNKPVIVRENDIKKFKLSHIIVTWILILGITILLIANNIAIRKIREKMGALEETNSKLRQQLEVKSAELEAIKYEQELNAKNNIKEENKVEK